MEKFSKEELESERWKDIDGYDGMYQVSDLGRVRSFKFGKTRLLRPGKTKDGYFIVQLWRNGKGKTIYVHRLVASAFIPNDDNSKTQINHINECKSDNKVSNLEYCTAQYNLTYNDIHHRRIANRISSKYKRNRIKDLYKPNLSYRQNLEIFRANGIECSVQTLYHLRRDLGLGKHKPN